MGEAIEETNEWYVKEALARPHTSLGIPSTCQSRSSTRLSEPLGSPEVLWKSSSKYIDPGYGYQRDWRSSRARVEGGGDSHFGRAAAPVALEEQEQWRPSIRYINPGSGLWSATGWRPSIKTVEPKCHDACSQWKPAIRVFKLSDCCTEWRMRGCRRHVPPIIHSEPGWRSCRGPGRPPPLKWAPPFRNLKLAPPKNKGLRRKVLGYSRKHPQLQLFPQTLEMAERSNPGNLLTPNAKEIRAKVTAYFKLHPPLHLFSTSLGKIGVGTNLGESNKDDSYHAIRRYIPEGHENHFENPGCNIKASTIPPLNSIKMRCATGPQHDPANCRNVITGKIGPLDHWKPPKVTLGPSLLAPAGNYQKDVIDNRFAGAQNTLEPEIPSYSSQLFNKAHESAHEDYKRNLVKDISTDYLKDYLYEVKDAGN